MKKVFYFSIICLGTSVYASDEMKIPTDSTKDSVPIVCSEKISISKETSPLSMEDLAKLPEAKLVPLINHREVLSLIPKCLEATTIKIGEYVKLDDWRRFPVRATDYPLKKTLIRYGHNFHLGYSIPIYRLYVDIKEKEKTEIMLIARKYEDSSVKFEHLERIGGYEFNDNFLEALRLTLIAIKLDEESEIVIDPPKLRDTARPILYKLIKSSNTVREYLRPDGKILVKNAELLQNWRGHVRPQMPVAAPVNQRIAELFRFPYCFY